MATLTEQIVEIHEHLGIARLPHAFGGAFALAFCTAEPRGTKDIDLNVFVAPEELDALADALPPGVTVTEENRTAIRREGQCRLWWDGTPIDVFMSNHPFHDHAAANLRRVPFAGVVDLPVLACADLAVFKCFFARPKDAVDLTAMVRTASIDLDDVERTVIALLGDSSERGAFFARVRNDLGRPG